MKTIQLSNGVEMPILGFGTYQITDPIEAEQAVITAIQAGYRLIDTAQIYLNEAAVGQAITKAGVDRKDLFITTKIWIENMSYDGVMQSFRQSMERLGLDYLDLLLIHQPYNDVYGAWRAMEELYEHGKIRAIGISNFSVDRAVDLAIFNKITPHINQIEINPFQQQATAIQALCDEGIMPQAWAPFAEGKNGIFHHPTLTTIAIKYGKSVAQVILRWLVQQDIIVLAKSVNPTRMAENIAIFDFELTTEDIAAIATLDVGESQFFSHSDPERIKWISTLTMNNE